LINECGGKVAFVTNEGDRLVADSMLSALVGFSTVLTAARAIPLQIECEQIEDCNRIAEFMKKYKLGKQN